MQNYNIGCVVMAAGNAARFGENKLAAIYEGKPLIRHALEAVPKGLNTVVVTQYDEVESMAAEFGFASIHNAHPDFGISHTIKLGTQACGMGGTAVLNGLNENAAWQGPVLALWLGQFA